MGDGIDTSVPGRPVELHEAALFALGTGTALALLAARHSLNAILFEVIGATILYALVILAGRNKTGVFGQRTRFLASFAFVFWFYCAVARITPALGTNLRDGMLLRMDEAIFGQTPAIFFERAVASWLTDLMSLCYMTYHLYLAVVVVHATWVPNSATQRLSAYLFTGFAIGLAGYLLVPAVGPARAYPELFREPLAGGTISRLIGEVVAKGSSGYDVFPSLHVLITCILLDHDWRQFRRRFWVMLIPALGLLVSTVYLRYHYGVDILAGLLLFLLLRQTFLQAWNRKIALPK